MNQKQIASLEKQIASDYDNLAGMVILQNGKTVYENYFHACDASNRFHVYSVTKSILSILIGIALDKGYIKNIDQKVLDFFPSYPVKKGEKVIQNITIRNLLTMTAPYKYHFASYAYIRYFMSNDLLTFTLNQLGGKRQTENFRYTPLIGPDILSGILVQVTGQSVLDFAGENLFTPLGITVSESIFFHNAREQQAFNRSTTMSGWVTDASGINTGGWGLTLSPVDMARIGQLYLNKGMWNGKQIVSARWIADTTQMHSCWKKQGLLYGYLWWIIDEKEHACAAMGDAGNVIYFNSATGVVVSIASLSARKCKDRIAFIRNYIEPALSDPAL